jgi:hypothetical protein
MYPLRFEVFTVTDMSTVVYLFVTACGLADGYQRFGETSRFHLQG